MPKSMLKTEAKSGKTRRILAVVAVAVLLGIVGFASPFALAMYGNAADHECGKTPHFDGSDPAARYDNMGSAMVVDRTGLGLCLLRRWRDRRRD